MRTQTITRELFTFDELDEAAQKAAVSSTWNALDFDPDYILSDFATICEIMGVSIKTRTVRLMNGGQRQEPVFYWSVGDRDEFFTFEGSYTYKAGAVAGIHAYAPLDTELHNIAEALATIQKRNFYQLTADISANGPHGAHVTVDVDRDSSNYQDPTADACDAVNSAIRDLAHWALSQLKVEYECVTSWDYIALSFRELGTEFTADGTPA